MAEEDIPEIRSALNEAGVDVKPNRQKYVPTYKVVGSTKIPVSSSMGKLWSSRKDQAEARRRSTGVEQSWDEAIMYHKNDQMSHRNDGSSDESGNRVISRRLNNKFSETENVVFSNTSSLVPAIYSKNPQAEFTVTDEQDRPIATILERLVNTIAHRRSAPGVNLKPKARRCVVMTTLTNRSYLEIGYTFKDQSSEQAMQDLRMLSESLAKARDKKEIERIEGQLMALEKRIDLLQPAGPWLKFRRPHQVLIDPDAQDDDLSDANWIMICDYLSTEFIKAVYSEHKKSHNEYRLVYQPTHVLKVGDGASGGVDDDINNFSLLQDGAESKSYGYSDEDTYRRAQRTKVWYVWDRVTRRVYLFNDKDWTWPIWVWDDPYRLDTFFPLFPLSFYTDPEGGEAKGEVTYYLDQQDAINEINDEERRARQWARRNIMFNRNMISRDDVERFLKGDDGTAVGVSLPEGATMADAVFSATPPSMQFAQLFDPTRKFAAIDRISSVTDIMRGAQFKTNTTNQAIAEYNQTQSVRLEEKIDALEDMLGSVYWAIAQLCLQFMDVDAVASLLGEQSRAQWRNMAPSEIQSRLSARVIGGTSVKPTSQAKKQEALQMGQILGQFASATPAAVVVALKVFEQAFDELVIKEEDWRFISQSIEQQLQRGNSQAGTTPSGDGTTSDQLGQIEQLVDGLPQQAKQALGQAIAQGVPVREAVTRIVEALQQQPQAD